MLLLIIATGALASLALAFAHYVSAFMPMSGLTQRLLGAATIAALSLINILGVKPGTRTTNVLTIIKVVALGALIVIGLGVPHTRTVEFVLAGPQGAGLLAAFGAALVPIFFSYGGWQQLNFVAGEIKDPRRGVPAALALGVGIVALIYLGANAVYLRALGPVRMAESNAIAQAAAQVLFGDFGERAITILIAISILAFSNVVVMVTPRVFYALARDGVFLQSLAQLDRRFQTPARAIILQGAWAILLVLVGSIGALVNGVVFADWIFFGLGAASLFVFRRRASGDAAAYRVPGYPLVPAFFVIAAVIAVVSAFASYPIESLIGVGALAAGTVLFVWKSRQI
jgi:APA family basic amino acid/polyamine antiporter